MNNGLFTMEAGAEKAGCEPGQSLHAVIAYENVTVGKYAMQLLGKLASCEGEGAEMQVVPWSFNILEDYAWQKFAMQDVKKADVLIIATNGLEPVPPAVLRWLEDVIGQLKGNEAAVISLQGSPRLSSSNGPGYQEILRSAAQRAGVAYFVAGLWYDQEALQQRADAVTPVLDKILHLQTSLKLTENDNGLP